jgi:hypothetical protein
MTIDKQDRPPSLDLFLAEHQGEIIQSLQDNPVVTVEYFDSPKDEERGVVQTIYFGVLQRGEVFDVWAFDEEQDEPLVWEDSFRSLDLAKSHLLRRASEVQAEKGDWLDEQKDVLWEEWKSSLPTLLPPFKFFDNATCSRGVILEFQSDVAELVEQNPWLLAPKDWPTGYSCKLYDAEGSLCWVAVSHRGEMVLAPSSPG